MKQRVLFFHRPIEGLKLAWMRQGFEVYELAENNEKLSTEEITRILQKYKQEYDIQYVFSFDFLPVIAEACYRSSLSYVSWVVDCPHVALWARAAEYPSNYIFCFDSVQCQRLREKGMKNVWHLPLATDSDYFQYMISEDAGRSRDKYEKEVSFVGNMYTDSAHALYDRITYLPPYLKGYLEALMNAQRQLWGVNILEEGINEQAWKMLQEHVRFDFLNQYREGAYELAITNMLGQKIAAIDRREICSYLARHFDFALYTGSDTSYDPAICNKGYIDYLREMPLAFYYTKINVHVTVRTITSGIPLRVLDVLACKGFLLTNYQAEIVEYFEDGKELVIYSDFADMYNKITYFLKHEEERNQIALAGYKKVKEQFHYNRQIRTIVQKLENADE